MRMKMAHQENKEHAVARAQTQPQSLLATAPEPLGVATSLLNLQRTHGNRFVQQVLTMARQSGDMVETRREEQETGRAPGGEGLLDHGIELANAEEDMDQGVTVHPLTIDRSIELSDTLPYRAQQANKLQRKLTVSQPGDRYEQEADRVAEQVMRMPEPRSRKTAIISLSDQGISLQRLCTECEEELQRSALLEEKEALVQAEQIPGRELNVTPDLETQIQNLKGGGQSLPESARSFFEPRFGYDFSQVRVHTDTQASELARAVNARAFTVGQDIVFGSGEYASETTAGKTLLAHELTHVLQQTGENSTLAPMQKVEFSRHTLQEDANSSAGYPIGKMAPRVTPQLSSESILQRDECCCCAESIAIQNISRIDNSTHMGHSFDAVISLSYPTSLSKASCTLEWWEKTNVPAIPGHKPNTWTDMYALYPISPTFDPWKNRSETCLTSQVVTITDPPALGKRPGRTVTRTLEFKIVINSMPPSSECACTAASQQVTATQVLSMVNGVPDWTSSSFTTP